MHHALIIIWPVNSRVTRKNRVSERNAANQRQPAGCRNEYSVTFTTRTKTFTIVIDKCVKSVRAINSTSERNESFRRIGRVCARAREYACLDVAYITPAGMLLLDLPRSFSAALSSPNGVSYLEHRGRDCRAGRYRFMNNSSRNCPPPICAYSVPIRVTARHVYSSVRALSAYIYSTSSTRIRRRISSEILQTAQLQPADALFTAYNRPHVKRDLMRIRFALA